MPAYSLPHDHGKTLDKVLETLPLPEHFATVSDLFKMLGDSNRSRIFWILCHSEVCVINLSAAMEMSSPAVSHHLRLLKEQGLIVSRRDGKEVYYRAARTPVAELLHRTIEALMDIACPGS